MKFKVGDVVIIKKEFSHYSWYHHNNMIITECSFGHKSNTYKTDYWSNDNLGIAECYLEYSKSYLRKLKLKNILK